MRSGKKGSFSVRPVMRFAAKGAAAGGAGFCGGSEVHCEQWCDSFLWDKWGASDGEGEDLEGFVFEQDARDGRDGIGSAVVNHRIRFEMMGDGREQVFLLCIVSRMMWISGMRKGLRCG